MSFYKVPPPQYTYPPSHHQRLLVRLSVLKMLKHYHVHAHVDVHGGFALLYTGEQKNCGILFQSSEMLAFPTTQKCPICFARQYTFENDNQSVIPCTRGIM